MSSLYKTRDRELERILSGKMPAGEGHDDLCLLVKELQGAFPEKPVPAEVESAHLAAMIESALLRPSEEAPVMDPSSDASRAVRRTTGLPKKRRKLVFAGLFASLAVKIAAVAVGGFAVFGGVAAAGALPDQVQSAVAHAAAFVGIDIPGGSAAPDAPKIPADVDLPAEANVPTSLPAVGDAGTAAPGAPGVPDHVTLPDAANVPSTVPVGPPATVPPVTVPVGPPATVPVGPPATELPPGVRPPVWVPPVKVPPVTVPTTEPPITIPTPPTVPPLPR